MKFTTEEFRAIKSHDLNYGMNKKDTEKLYTLLNPEPIKFSGLVSVEEYIETHDVKTEERISKKGTKLIKVFYENGTIKEYPKNMIGRITAFDI